MFRRLLLSGLGALALTVSLALPGQVHARGMRSGFRSGMMTPGFRRGDFDRRGGFGRRFNNGFFNPRFNSRFNNGFLSPRFTPPNGFTTPFNNGMFFNPGFRFSTGMFFDPRF